MNDERVIADLHERWVFGWDRREGDEPFDFRRVFGEFYDFGAPDVRLYDDFDPEHRVATSAAAYGEIWTPAFQGMTSAHHAVDDGPHVLVSGDLAASTLRFAARIATPDAVTDIRTTTSLVWRRTPDGWRIVREHNSTQTLPAGELDGRFGEDSGPVPAAGRAG
ncbi:nuclear transport factor 2 family protein [Lentzea sp. CC55]|uniref:YybH family protein n=1 Tax=Lentzea sp. CC55 TaxID=2884909 RepID=UPI001F267E7F|nr:nuclear transport factor 2 family protein [Lentzea sp. CC55]MCG8923064.1 nuclear transport factor 2 family protein [Lentzea sp. CC55]